MMLERGQGDWKQGGFKRGRRMRKTTESSGKRERWEWKGSSGGKQGREMRRYGEEESTERKYVWEPHTETCCSVSYFETKAQDQWLLQKIKRILAVIFIWQWNTWSLVLSGSKINKINKEILNVPFNFQISLSLNTSLTQTFSVGCVTDQWHLAHVFTLKEGRG